ncbi:MFS transporter [Microbacterium trichothecenolyticum]|uniref:MFS transporter n=1 Tax=Microbacterium ureisolvens TaxID=2781186 RepID=A0ABS7I0S7_9MICO|nr:MULTISPECIES: MFS transporter [Microbacterium]MBW9110431.1 MFS transporter [Microbacterium ureisolvens]MBW9120536.1 MFS transporter [Microbacterium trichothecenolyticum]
MPTPSPRKPPESLARTHLSTRQKLDTRDALPINGKDASMTDAVQGTTVSPRTAHSRARRQGMIAACVGNSLENYDWLVYAAFSAILAAHFFPTDNPAAALLGTLAIFAVGFFFRPLGGLVLTTIADRRGRKFALIVSILLMTGGSFLIGVSPTYEVIGIGAPILLFVARAMQGLSLGGEHGAVASYLNEQAPPSRRGFFGSFQYATLLVGSLVATGTSALLNTVMVPEALMDWGWRIPFLFGGLIGLATLWMRRNMEETDAFQEAEEDHRKVKNPSLTLLRTHPRQVIGLFLLAGLAGVWFYTFASYLPNYVQASGLDPKTSLLAGVIALTVALICTPFIGHFSDVFGRRLFVLIFTAFCVVGAVPLLLILQPTFGSQLLVQTVALLGYSFFGAAGLTAMTEQFPTEIRAIGTGLPYALGFAIFGGTAPLFFQWLTDVGLAQVFPWYVTVLAVLALIAIALSVRDRRGISMQDIK